MGDGKFALCAVVYQDQLHGLTDVMFADRCLDLRDVIDRFAVYRQEHVTSGDVEFGELASSPGLLDQESGPGIKFLIGGY